MQDQRLFAGSPLFQMTTRVREKLDDMIEHLQADIQRTDDPHALALFQTTAEVLDGIKDAYEDFERQTEEAWLR